MPSSEVLGASRGGGSKLARSTLPVPSLSQLRSECIYIWHTRPWQARTCPRPLPLLSAPPLALAPRPAAVLCSLSSLLWVVLSLLSRLSRLSLGAPVPQPCLLWVWVLEGVWCMYVRAALRMSGQTLEAVLVPRSCCI
jgi:hypothetical protein